jgi:hypothetical protein
MTPRTFGLRLGGATGKAMLRPYKDRSWEDASGTKELARAKRVGKSRSLTPVRKEHDRVRDDSAPGRR